MTKNEVRSVVSICSVLLSVLIVPGLQSQSGVRQDATNDLTVLVGRSVLLDCANPVQRVAVGLGGFAEVVAITPTEIMVNGKAPGETSLIVWEKGGTREFFNVTVRASDSALNDHLESVRRELRRQLPGEPLKVTGDNGTVFLSGTVNDMDSSDRAVQIASVAGKVVNLLNVKVPTAEPQVLLKVVFASVDRNRSRQLGINMFSNGFGNVLGSVSTGQFSPPSVTTAGTSLSSDLNLFAFLPGLNLGATLEALETKGLVQVLAEPNVLAENGKQGSFLAGGEYPYPVVQGTAGNTAITIMFKEFGIRLNFIPTITPRRTIHLQVAPEVSSLDFVNGVQVSGFQVPAIAIRRVKTEVELAQGQSFAISGLLDNRETETFEKIPFISSVPILGKFFQSINRTKSNTELIVIVTPEIVQPIPQGTEAPRPNFPQPFMAPNTGLPMHTPVNSAATAAPAPATITVEQMQRDMKPKKPLAIDSDMSAAGGGSTQ